VLMPSVASPMHPGPTEIALPGNFGSLPIEHRAVVLAIFLGR